MLTKKERAILFLLNKMKRISKIKLVKMMFIISKKTGFYSFVPYSYGPFSFELYHDLARLEKAGYVSMNEESISLTGKDIPPLDSVSQRIINDCSRNLLNYEDNQIMNYTYSLYPEFTIFSRFDRRIAYEKDSAGIITTGYEGKSIDFFLYELILNKVDVVVDVRRNAFSMKFGFSKFKLRDYLKKVGIEYIHIPELGIPSLLRKELRTYEDRIALFANYEKELETKSDLLERIKEIGKTKKVVLMCFEKDAKFCHRGIIAKRLISEGVEVSDLRTG